MFLFCSSGVKPGWADLEALDCGFSGRPSNRAGIAAAKSRAAPPARPGTKTKSST
jgi:hypothetical protein